MTVRDNLEAGKYENKVPFSVEKISVDERCGRRATMKAAEKLRLSEQRRLHRENEGAMTALLQHDLEDEYGLVGHPKAGKLFALAWDHGHSSGYGEVIHYYEEFVELLK